MTTLEIMQKGEGGRAGTWPSPRTAEKNRALECMAESLLARTDRTSSRPTPQDVRGGQGTHQRGDAGPPGAHARARVEGMAEGIKAGGGASRPGGARASSRSSGRTACIIETRGGADGRDRDHLREPPERDLGCGGAWLSRRAARASCAAARRPSAAANAIVDGAAAGLAQAGLDPELRVRLVQDTTRASAKRADDRRVGYVDLLDPAGRGRADPRLRARTRRCPASRPAPASATSIVDASADHGHGARYRRKRQDQPPLGLQRRGGAVWCTRTIAAGVSAQAARAAGETRGRQGDCTRSSCAWTRRALSIMPGAPAGRRRLRHGIPRLHPGGEGGGQRSRRPLPTSPPTPPATATPSSPRDEDAAGRFTGSGGSARRSTSTPPPALPTAASSAWAARWASPPRSCTPAGRWACEELTSYKYVVRGDGQVR